MAGGIVALTMGHGLDSLRLRASARHVASTLRYAREKAITTQTIYKVGFQVEQNQFYLADEAEVNRKSFSLDKDVRFKSVKIDGAEAAGRARMGERYVLSSEINFFPNGSSNSGEIILETAKGSKERIVTDILTGIAKVSRVTGRE
jgi:Tfp pilus assembly protein FimT